MITNPRDGAIWNAGFSNTSRGPYIGELQVDLVCCQQAENLRAPPSRVADSQFVVIGIAGFCCQRQRQCIGVEIGLNDQQFQPMRAWSPLLVGSHSHLFFQLVQPPTLPPTPLPTPLPTPSPTPSLQQPATPSSTVTSTNSTVLTPVQTTVPTTMTSRSVVQVESTTISTMAPSNSTATTTVMTVVATTTSEDNSALIGGIVGGIVALLLIVGVIAFFVARSRRNSAGNFHPANRDDDSLASAPAPSSSTYGAIGTDGIKVGNYANSTMVTASEQSDGGTPRDQYLGLSKVNNNNNNDYIGLRQVASPKPAPYGDLEKK